MEAQLTQEQKIEQNKSALKEILKTGKTVRAKFSNLEKTKSKADLFKIGMNIIKMSEDGIEFLRKNR